MTKPAAKRKFFLSLKWKAIFLTSLVLAIVTLSFAVFNYHEFWDLFHERRESLQEQYAQQVQGFLDQSNNRLQQINATTSSLVSKQTANARNKQSAAVDAFELLTPILEVDMGIESLALFSKNGQRLAANHVFTMPTDHTAILQSVQRVISTESPISLIDCSATCLLYSIAPVNDSGGSLGAIVLGSSLADVVLDFKGVSGTDLGLVVEQETGGKHPQGDNDRWLPDWNANVFALSDAEKNLPLLKSITQRIRSPEQLIKPLFDEHDDRELEIRAFQLHGFGAGQKAYLIVIADIGTAVSRIRETTKRSIFIGTAGLLVSEVLLLAILWHPMSRLKRAAAILPKLAEGSFSSVRYSISEMRPGHVLRDEVDDLNDTAIALSHQLEALNEEVAKRATDLSQRMEEITKEKNFVTNVLDTAQAVILTQNKNQEILMVNPYGQALLGYTSVELLGMPFCELLVQSHTGTDLQGYLQDLAEGLSEHFEWEADLVSRDNNTLNIVWQHSRLHRNSLEDPVILSVGMDITARKRAEMRLAWLADHDPLTGLYNRRRFEKELEEAISSAKRYRYTGALLFFDLDQFKYVNDTSGHGAGDQLLVNLSNTLPTLLREVDIIGRLGGDEFGVILSHASADEAVLVARKILTHINETEFAFGNRVHKVSASIGVAIYPDHGSDVQDLLARTDLAMYQVKESGRGGWYLLSSDDRSHRVMQERVLWKQRVENALAEHQFVLFAQPIMHIQSGITSHWEVLLRMLSDDGTLIPPIKFIEVAENTGLIHALDRMVLTEAARHLALMKGKGRQITLAVNLSAHAFKDQDLLAHVKQVITLNGIEPRQLIFEMTETAAVADIGPAKKLMESINEIGCQFALDDFGTGFSSFDYVRQLPFAYIKIDGSFIRSLPSRRDDQVLVRSMVDIASAFGKRTIAEMVEDAETLALLKEYGVDYSQGYYTGKPMEITSALQLAAPN